MNPNAKTRTISEIANSIKSAISKANSENKKNGGTWQETQSKASEKAVANAVKNTLNLSQNKGNGGTWQETKYNNDAQTRANNIKNTVNLTQNKGTNGTWQETQYNNDAKQKSGAIKEKIDILGNVETKGRSAFDNDAQYERYLVENNYNLSKGKALDYVKSKASEQGVTAQEYAKNLRTSVSNTLDTEKMQENAKNGKVKQEDLDKINQFGVLLDENGNEADINKYNSDINLYKLTADNINKSIEDLNNKYNKGLISYEDLQNQYANLQRQWEDNQIAGEKLNNYKSVQGFDYYDWAKANGKDVTDFEKYAESFDDSYIERLAETYSASVVDALNTPVQAYEILKTIATRNTDNPYDFADPTSLSSQLTAQSQELQAYAFNGIDGFQEWSLQTVSSLMPMVHASITGMAIGGAMGATGKLLTEATSDATNAILGVQTAGQVTRQRINEGNDLTSATINGIVHGVITALVEKGDAGSVASIFTGDAEKILTDMMLSNQLASKANYWQIAKYINAIGVAEGAEEIIEAVADHWADNIQNSITKSFEGIDPVEAETLDPLELANQFVMAYAGAMIMGAPTAVKSTIFAINSNKKYQSALSAKTWAESVLQSELAPQVEKIMAKDIIDAVNIETQNYKNASVTANAVVYPSEVAPKMPTYDEAMQNLTNAVRQDVQGELQTAQETLNQAQNLKAQFAQELSNRGYDVSIDDYINFDDKTKNDAKTVLNFAKKTGLNVKIVTDLETGDGKISSEGIVIDAKNKPLLSTLAHEVTHGTESSKYYQALDDLVSKRFGDEKAIQKEMKHIKEVYAKHGVELDEVGARKEFVAKQVEKLLGNEEFINELVNYNPSIARRIYDDIVLMGSDDLAKIKVTFEKAFQEFSNKQSAQYSIDDSKIIDNRDILNTNYSEKEIDITHNNGDYIEGLDYSIEDFFNNFKNSPEQKILLLGKVNNDFTNKVLKDTGIDLNGKSLALASDNHLDNNMGALHNLANILNDYDSVEYYIENGEQRLRFKTDTNNDYSVIELVPKRNISSLLVNNYTNENKNVKYSIDTDYEQAVNNGDMETAQKLVDEKANEWANSEDNKQVIVNGKKVLFRSADGGKTVFDRSANGHTNNVLFMTTDENVARGFDSSRTGEKSNVTKFFVRGNNVLEIEANGDIYAGITVDENNVPEWYPTTYNVDWNNEANDYVQTVSVDLDNLVEKAFDNGYDVVVAKNVKEGTGDITNDVIVKDSRTQIKSAEPVTYDNNGNVIPLSERFNSNNKDIRWSIDTEETSASKQSDDALKFAEQIIDNNGKVVEEAKENTEDIAKVLSEVPEKENKKEQLKYWLDKFKYYITNSGVYVDNIAKETGNKKISEKYDYMLMSDTMANSALADGHYDIYGNKIDNGIVGVFEGLTDEKRSDFDNYIYHLRNINDMSITDRFKPQAVVDLAEELMKNDKNLTYTDAIKKASEELVSKKTKEIAKGSKISKEDAKEQAYNSIFSEYQNKPVFGESVTAEKSKEFTKEMEEKHPDFKERSKRLFEYENNELQLLYQYGIINEEQMNRMTAMHYNFAPIMRDVDVQKGAGTTNANKALKAQKGSNLDILPLDYAIINRTNSIYRSITSNNLYKEIYGSMKMEGTKGKSVSLLDEFSTNLLDIDKNTRSKYITLYENGQPIQLEIGDGLYDSLKPNRVVKLPVLSSLADFRRNMITGWNPIFWITNGMKDIQDVPYNTKFNAVEYTKGYAEAWKQITNHGKLYDLYLANGGAQNSRIKQFTGEVKSTSDVKQLFNFGEVIETVPRLAEFIATLNNGGSIEEAMFNASEVTVNFKRGGVWSKNLNANGFTFLNASILGTVKQMNNIKQAYTKKGAIGVASYMAKMSLMYNVPLMLLNYLLWRDDDDYEQLSEYVKNNYYCIGKVGHTFIRLPKGRLNAFYQTCISNGVKTAQGKQDLWEALLSDAESFATNIAPNKLSESSLIAPIEQAIKGKNWYGGDIVPSRLQDVPEENQFDESIDEISKWIGKKTHTSPYKINYILDQYTGLAGDFVLPMFTLQATNGIDNKIVSGLASPILDKFTSNSIFKNQYVSDFYEMKNELNTQSKYDDASDEVKLSNKYMATMMYELNQLYKKKREIQNKTDLSNGDKYDQVEEIQMQIDALAKVALETYDQIDKVDNYAIVGDLEYHKTEDGWEKLTSKQLEKVKGLNLTTGEKSEFFDTYSEINDAREELKENTPEGEQADYSELTMSEIFNSGLDDSAKNRLYDTYYGSTFTSNVNKMSYDDATKLKIKSIVATTESDKDKDGNTISNSKAQKVKEQYIALGVYDDIVKYIQDNDLKYTVFGLSKTVVEGSTKSSGKSSKSKSTLATTYAKTFKSSDVGSTNTSTKQTSLSGFKKAYSNTLKTSGKTSNGYAYVTCPNCHSRVIPSNNTCPVCGNKL